MKGFTDICSNIGSEMKKVMYILLCGLTALFHGWGIVMWLVTVAWIPF